MQTDFLASGNHFLSFFLTAVNCCQWKQIFLQLEHIFQPILRSVLMEMSFLSTRKSIVIFRVFSASGNYYWNLGWDRFLLVNTNFFLSIFSEILKFLKVQTTFPYSGNAFFSKFFIRVLKKDFLSSGNSVFWTELFSC